MIDSGAIQLLLASLILLGIGIWLLVTEGKHLWNEREETDEIGDVLIWKCWDGHEQAVSEVTMRTSRVRPRCKCGASLISRVGLWR